MSVAVCPYCGQRGDQSPGLWLDEFPDHGYRPVGDEMSRPQRLTCRSCGQWHAVERDLIQPAHIPRQRGKVRH